MCTALVAVPVMFWCTPHTAGRTLGSSPGTAGDTRAASCPQLQYCPPSPPGPEQQQQQQQRPIRRLHNRPSSSHVICGDVSAPVGVWRRGRAA